MAGNELHPPLFPAKLMSARSTGPTLIRWLGLCVDWSVIILGGVMAALVFLNVIMHVLGRDLAWVTELGELLMVWVSFLGGAAALQRGSHMSIAEFVDKLSARGRQVADAGIQVVTLVVLGMLVFFGWRLVQANWNNELTVLGWPMAIQYMGMAIGCTAMFLFAGFDFVQIVYGVGRASRYPAGK